MTKCTTVKIFFLVRLLSDKTLELIRFNFEVGANGGMGGDRHDL